MATVKITPSIRNNIENACHRSFSARIAEAQKGCYEPENMGQKLLDLWLDAEDGRRALYESCKHWLVEEREMITLTVNDWMFGSGARTFGWNPVTRNHLTKPLPKLNYNDPSRTITTDDPEIVGIITRIIEARGAVERLQLERGNFTRGVLALIDKHVTINRAVEEWPDLRLLLSDAIKERLDYVPPPKVRPKKVDPLTAALHRQRAIEAGEEAPSPPAVDTDQLTSALTANILINTNIGGT